MKRLSLPRTCRLNTPKAYQAVFREPFKSQAGPFIVLAITNQTHFARLGLIVAKKHVKKATDRNKLKRLIRESFRHKKADLPGLDIVVLLRKPTGNMTSKDIFKYLEKSWTELAGAFKKSALV